VEYVQRWDDVLFLHWRVDAGELQSRVPAALEVDTFDGSAWISAVIFRLRSRVRGMPHFPFVSSMTEVNLRTYVRCGGAPGIWLLSVRADHRIAARIARWLTPMPYTYCPLRYASVEHGFEYRDPEASLAFRPTGSEAAAPEGSFDAWLLERYRLFAQAKSAPMKDAVVVHEPWAVRAVEFAAWKGNFGGGVGMDLRRPPDAAHFSTGVGATFGKFERLSISEALAPVASQIPVPLLRS